MKVLKCLSLVAILGIAQRLMIVFGEMVEEFHVHGPTEFHENAMKSFMEQRRINPNITLDTNGEFLQKANEYAIKRGRRRPEEALKLKVSQFLKPDQPIF